MSAPRDYVLTFAGAGEQPVQGIGRHVRILEASNDVYLRINDSTELKRRAGQAVNFGSGAEVRRLAVRSLVAQTVRLVVADVPQDDDQESVSVTVTATVAPANTVGAGGDVAILAAATTLISAADATRKTLIVKNPASNVGSFRVGGLGVGAAKGIEIDPGESIAIDTTAAVYGHNQGAGTESLQVLPVQEV